MLAQTLYRWGRYAARRPWTVIGAWLLLAAVVVGSSATVGRDFEDSFGEILISLKPELRNICSSSPISDAPAMHPV